MIIHTPYKIDLASSLHSGQAHRWRVWGTSEDQDVKWHIGVVRGTLIKIREVSQGKKDGPLTLEVRWKSLTNNQSIQLLIADYFRFGDDLNAIYLDISQDSLVKVMLETFKGLRLLRQEPWECLVAFICSANSNLARIHANMEVLAQQFGDPITLEGVTRYTFPTPSRVAEVGESHLRALGLGFRAPYVLRASEMVAAGEVALEGLKEIPYLEAKEALMTVPGVGPKVADCVLLHGMDKLEAFPIDVWVRRALNDWYFLGHKPPSNQVMSDWARSHFGPYAGYAQLYLFHGRRMQKQTRQRPSI